MNLQGPYEVIVVGGGAAGMAAAIAARRDGASVLILERLPLIGKKVLASGNGRCNLLNEVIEPDCYNAHARRLVKIVFEKYPADALLDFFAGLGLATVSEKGRVFPATNQAVSVMEVIEQELLRLGVKICCGCEVSAIEAVKQGLSVSVKGQTTPVLARTVILCGGGKSYPSFGTDGTAYALARSFGHRLIEPVPSAVPLAVKDFWCHKLQGQRIRASVTALAGSRKLAQADGELLFTKYGLSGSAVLDVSEDISVALNREHQKSVQLVVDLLPAISEPDLQQQIAVRLNRGWASDKLLIGLLPPKFAALLEQVLASKDSALIARLLKAKRFDVVSTLSWNEAEFTTGGLDIAQVDPQTLESVLRPGLFMAGEILDVVGRRGGYNLAWAWASGLCSGKAAYASVKTKVF